ncbi:Aste57867_64 [Aphanomyces stellatus]|uniref:Aste57867_64 protein n=1 Tax=Aphanomyces stellatus TaxID=120398 RepID=A0A485K1V3_9STRA|nr:hypothetical protein As57867_000064 [Aphanomyces stellatus]VFT77290.1 Aste57867_64 [Aphanomyces stellatus]
MLEKIACCVGACSPSAKLVAQHDLINYRWLFYTSEASSSLYIARAPLPQSGDDVIELYSPVQTISLPSAPQNGEGLLFGPEKRGATSNERSLEWHCEATWRCEPNMKCPLKWCESKEDLWLIAADSKLSIWKVVDDAVTVYANRSFELGTSTHLFDACSTGRYAATASSAHARLAKVWALSAWTMEMTKPSCVFLGHSRALVSMEWTNPGLHVMDNATLLTLDAAGEVTLWREDSNAATFGFIRSLRFDTADLPAQVRCCGAISQRKSPVVTPLEMKESTLALWKTAAPSFADKTHDLYTHTMDRFHMKTSKTLGFAFRAGATADTHEGEKFIQGNLALSKCSIAYLIYAVLANGDLCVWRVDCTTFLTSTPRATLICSTTDMHHILSEASLLYVSSLDFSCPLPFLLAFFSSYSVATPSTPFHLSISLTTNLHDLQVLSMQLAPTSPTTLSHILNWSITPGIVASMGALDAIADTAFGEPNTLLFRDTQHMLFGMDTRTQRTVAYNPTLRIAAAAAIMSIGLVFCITSQSELIVICNRSSTIKLDQVDGSAHVTSFLHGREEMDDSSAVVRFVGVATDTLFLWRVDVSDPNKPRLVEKAVLAIPSGTICATFLGNVDSFASVTSGDDSALYLWRLTNEPLTLLSIRQTPLVARVRQVQLHPTGLMVMLLDSPSVVQIQHVWDPVHLYQWPVDPTVHAVGGWMQQPPNHIVICLSSTALHLFGIDGTPILTQEIPTGMPASLNIPSSMHHHPWMYLAHGASITRYMLTGATSQLAPVATPWTPLVLVHFLLQGAFKSVERVLQSLVDAISLQETQSYMDMKEARVSFPSLAWKAVCLDASGKDDRLTFTKKKDTAAMLFAPRVTAAAKTKPTTDFDAFFTADRLQLVPEPALFRSICLMLKCEQDATDLPGLKFLVRLLWRDAVDDGLCAEALLWARLSSMDLFALPYFQTLTMEWKHMQQLRLPFWLDDIQRLRQKTEQVAQREYAASKDPFTVALYYVLLGKTRVLSGLFRLAKESKIAELLVNDFSEDRWKAAAIKNAFVLKSKQRYTLAATFFLLGGKVYEAASIAESADPSCVLSFLILRLSEPSSLHELGPTTRQFVQTVLVSKAGLANDVYMQCFCAYLLENQLVLDSLLHRPKSSMSCVFLTTPGAYWRTMGATLYGACQLVQHASASLREEQEPECLALFCTAASRLHAQGHSFLAYSLVTEMGPTFSALQYLPQWSWVESTRVCMSLACLEDQLQHLCPPFLDALDKSLGQPKAPPCAFPLQTKLEQAWSHFPLVGASEMAQLLRPHSTVAWLLASQWFDYSTQPVLDQVECITNAMDAPALPSMVLQASLSLIEYLYLMPDEDAGVVRVATAAIYTALALVFPTYACRLSRCCVGRLLCLMFPHKEIGFTDLELCLTCLDYKPRVMPSLRQDLPHLFRMVQLLLATSLLPKKATPDCADWIALSAAIHHTMEQHVMRLTDQLDLARQLQTKWKSFYTPRVVPSVECSHGGACDWRHLFQLLIPAATSVLDFSLVPPPENGKQDNMFSEVIYRSDVPGESIRAMCCNMQQKNTVVFCNGRFLYRALAKKPPKTSSVTSTCQLHVNAKYSPPTVFFAADMDQQKSTVAATLSPQPDSKGSGNYRPIAVQSHPALPLFCSGTTKGSVEVWRFDQTTSCNVFEHLVAPATNTLAPLTTPRRDVHRIRFANSGHILGACDGLGYVYLWNFASEGASACYAHLQCHNRGTRDFAFLNASSCVASVGSSTKKKNLCLWDTLLPPHKALICAPLCHPMGATSVVFSSRHQLLISGGESGSLNIFDVRRQRSLYAVSTAHDSAITTLALHPKGHCVLSGSANGDVKIWSLPLFRELSSWVSTRPRQPSFLGDASSFATTAPTVTGITDAFATEDFFYASASDGVIQRYQTPLVPSLPA